MTWTCSLLIHSIWKTTSPHGTCASQSVKRQTHAHCGTRTKWCTPVYTCRHSNRHTDKGERKLNQEADRDSSFHSDICLVPETDGEPIRLPGASATLHLQCHPSAPPQNLHPGTNDRWHLANVTLLLPWKIIYVFITVTLYGADDHKHESSPTHFHFFFSA